MGKWGGGREESQRKRCQSDARTLWDRKIQHAQVEKRFWVVLQDFPQRTLKRKSMDSLSKMGEFWNPKRSPSVLFLPLKKLFVGRRKELRRGKPNQSSQRIGLVGISPIYSNIRLIVKTENTGWFTKFDCVRILCTFTKLSNPTPCVRKPAAASACSSLSHLRPSVQAEFQDDVARIREKEGKKKNLFSEREEGPTALRLLQFFTSKEEEEEEILAPFLLMIHRETK